MKFACFCKNLQVDFHRVDGPATAREAVLGMRRRRMRRQRGDGSL